MLDHHQQTIHNLRRHFEADPAVLALIIIGSTVRGEAGPESDVDFFLIVTDPDYTRREAAGELDCTANDLCVPPCPLAEGMVKDLRFLRDAADHGPEPARFAFVNARVAFSRLPEIMDLVPRIPVYPENERTGKMRSFYCQTHAHFSFLELAEYSQNPYLLDETAVKIVLFGGRLLLAHNRILYPGRKGFMRALRDAPDKPDGIMDRAEHLLRSPSIAAGQAFIEPIMAHARWPLPPEGCRARYQRDSVWHWQQGWCPIEDR